MKENIRQTLYWGKKNIILGNKDANFQHYGKKPNIKHYRKKGRKRNA